MNLTETQVSIKKGVIVLVMLIAVFYTGKFFVNLGLRACASAKLPICYTPPADPQAAYGALPRLKMSSLSVNEGIEYTLFTQTGGFPSFPDRLTVYKIPQPTSNLLSEREMKDLATTLGFDNEPIKAPNSESDLIWTDTDNSRQLNSNVVSKAFNLDTKVDKLASVTLATPEIRPEQAIDTATNFIKSQQLMSTIDIANIRYHSVPTTLTLGRLKETVVATDPPKLINVNIYRDLVLTNIDNSKTVYKILGPKPSSSLISFFVTNSTQKEFTYPLMTYNYWQSDYNDNSDYYLSPISNVWNAVSQGQGIISEVKVDGVDYYTNTIPAEISTITIQDIYIAYYETKEYQEYLQPMYVFEGRFSTVARPNELPKEGTVVIYYPAVRGDFVQ